MRKIVRKTLAEAKAELTGQQDELKRLKEMPDSHIYFSDLPELTEKFRQDAVANHLPAQNTFSRKNPAAHIYQFY